ncbi:MAG: terminase small subunit [Verrucomicrobiota bacterium]
MKPLNSRQEKFAQLVASGMPATPAYVAAGYKVTTKVAGTNGPRMLEFAGVAARIKELRTKTSERSEFKRADLVRFLVAVLQTPVGELEANSPLVQEITTDAIGNTTTRKRVKMMGKAESARLLVDIMGWKAPEHHVVETGPKALDAIKDRAAAVASALDLRARMREAAQAARSNGHANGPSTGSASALSRWPT